MNRSGGNAAGHHQEVAALCDLSDRIAVPTGGVEDDEIRVTGGGLAVGTPVSYRLDFSISGSVLGVQPDPTFGAFGTASVSLQDYITGKSVFMNWDNRRDATGIYSLTLNTVVGSSLLINASLQTGARVQGNSINARFASNGACTLNIQ